MTAPQASPPAASALERSIRYVKGVGPQRLAQLAQLGIETLDDACYYAPRRYEDRTCLLPIREARPGQTVTVRGDILAKSLRRARRGRAIVEISVGDGTGILSALWFHQPYLARALEVGQEVILYGTLEPKTRPQMIHPEIERVEAHGDPSMHMGRIVPVYPLAAGMSQRWLRQVVAAAVEQERPRLDDMLPEPVRLTYGFPTLAEAIGELHAPSAWPALERAKARLAFEELFVFQLALAQRRAKTARREKPQRYQLDGPLADALRERLPFALTAAQQRVLQELAGELARPFPMHRLLQGDVGCGKTVVVACLIAAAVQRGHQVAVMAPTELLAEQHARVLGGLLEPLGVAVSLLSQGVPPPERTARRDAIAGGTIQVVVGTHALIQRGVVFKDLALVVIDEQHKFGVLQRARLAKKAQDPDVLVMTATPIPRTLALSIYGDLDLSTIDELPPGRRPIATRWMHESERSALYALIRQQLREGRQGYVVYPLVSEGSATPRKAATQMSTHLRQEVFPECKVGLLHGQMPPKTKETTMRAFARGEIQLLVSTVIVEVGLDVPNATVMVIEHPERFGLAQLHQLRGRIGRGPHQATCIVVGDPEEEPARERLRAFIETSDGFELAEKDLEQRGPGALLGRRQHGWLRFRIAHLSRDRQLLESARQEAAALIRRDPELRDPALARLRERLRRFRQQPG